MKNEIGNEILGIWRHSNDDFTIDFAIRSWDDKSKHKSILTKINNQEGKTESRWEALVDIIASKDEWSIEVNEVFTEDSIDHEYLNLSIVQKDFERGYIVIKADGGKDMVFNKIG